MALVVSHSGLSPVATSSVAAVTGPTPLSDSSVGSLDVDQAVKSLSVVDLIRDPSFGGYAVRA